MRSLSGERLSDIIALTHEAVMAKLRTISSIEEFTKTALPDDFAAALHEITEALVKQKETRNSNAIPLMRATENAKRIGKREELENTFNKGTTSAFIDTYVAKAKEELGIKTSPTLGI